jgi:hypothetical protein
VAEAMTATREATAEVVNFIVMCLVRILQNVMMLFVALTGSFEDVIEV